MFMFGCWSGSVLEHGSWFLHGVRWQSSGWPATMFQKKKKTTGRLFVAGARWSDYQFRPATNQLENTDSSLTWIVVVPDHVEQLQ